MTERLMTTTEAAAALGVSLPMIGKAIRRGTLAGHRLPGTANRWGVTPAAIAAYRAAHSRGRDVRCPTCGDLFMAEEGHARFCSRACRQLFYHRRSAGEPTTRVFDRACAHCGGIFEAETAHRRYCCTSCRVRAFGIRHGIDWKRYTNYGEQRVTGRQRGDAR